MLLFVLLWYACVIVLLRSQSKLRLNNITFDTYQNCICFYWTPTCIISKKRFIGAVLLITEEVRSVFDISVSFPRNWPFFCKTVMLSNCHFSSSTIEGNIYTSFIFWQYLWCQSFSMFLLMSDIWKIGFLFDKVEGRSTCCLIKNWSMLSSPVLAAGQLRACWVQSAPLQMASDKSFQKSGKNYNKSNSSVWATSNVEYLEFLLHSTATKSEARLQPKMESAAIAAVAKVSQGTARSLSSQCCQFKMNSYRHQI